LWAQIMAAEIGQGVEYLSLTTWEKGRDLELGKVRAVAAVEAYQKGRTFARVVTLNRGKL